MRFQQAPIYVGDFFILEVTMEIEDPGAALMFFIGFGLLATLLGY